MTEQRPATRLVVDGVEHPLAPGPDRSLLFVLREELGLTGAKPGCGEGACGSCTVLLGDAPVRACQVHLSELGGRAVRTVEGLSAEGRLHPVQQAFLEVGAFQCGYCTPGMIMGAYAFLLKNPKATRAAIIKEMDSHLCRCGAHVRIVQAIETAAVNAKGGAR